MLPSVENLIGKKASAQESSSFLSESDLDEAADNEEIHFYIEEDDSDTEIDEEEKIAPDRDDEIHLSLDVSSDCRDTNEIHLSLDISSDSESDEETELGNLLRCLHSGESFDFVDILISEEETEQVELLNCDKLDLSCNDSKSDVEKRISRFAQYESFGKELLSYDFFHKALFLLNQTYPNWKMILGVEFGTAETICVPNCLDVGLHKFFGPTTPRAADFDKKLVKMAKSQLKGQSAEEGFFIAFRKLKLGGILIHGFETKPFIQILRDSCVPGFEQPKIGGTHFECDFIFIHQRLGVVVIETKGCNRKQEMTGPYNSAIKQLVRQIDGLKDIYMRISKEHCPFDVRGIVCMPNIDITKTNRILNAHRTSSIDFIQKSMLQNLDKFTSYWNFKKQNDNFNITEAAVNFIVALFAYRSAKFMSAACNAIEIYRRIEIQDFNNRLIEPSQVIFYNIQQLAAIQCKKHYVVITGPPGTGKTLCLLQRVLNASRVKKRGRVILAIALADDLLPKFQKFCAKNYDTDTKRKPIIAGLGSFKYFSSHDDVFIDEISTSVKFSEYFQRIAKRARLRSGSTTIVITGHWEPQEILDTKKIHEIFPQFEHFELKTVVRGTKIIIDEWKTNFPDRYLTIGHNITGTPIERILVSCYSEMFKVVCSKVKALLAPIPILETLRPKNQQVHQLLQCRPCDIAVITLTMEAYENQKLINGELRKYLRHNGIPCGSITKQVNDPSIVAVDEVYRTPSYEWAIVIVVELLQRAKSVKSKFYLLAASRTIANLIVIRCLDERKHKQGQELGGLPIENENKETDEEADKEI